MLSCNFSDATLRPCFPYQIVLRQSNLCFILFNSGQCRVMGKSTFTNCVVLFDHIVNILSCNIITPLHVVSYTLTHQLPLKYCPLNLHMLIKKFDTDTQVHFEPELFPALYITKWTNCHVNVFSTGKIIVLGKNATVHLDSIYKWIMKNLFL